MKLLNAWLNSSDLTKIKSRNRFNGQVISKQKKNIINSIWLKLIRANCNFFARAAKMKCLL